MSHALTPLDSAFLLLELPGSSMHIGAVITLDTEQGADPTHRFQLIRDTLAARLQEIPVFTQRVERAPWDRAWPRLVPDVDFDLDRHVARATLPPPGTEEQFHELLGAFWSRPLPRDRPLWQLLVVDASTGTPAAVVLKVHHSLADGVSGVATFAGLFDVTPDIRAGRERPAESDCEATVAQRGPRERRAALMFHPMRLATSTARSLGRWWTASGAVTRFLVRGHRRAVPGQPSIFTARRTSFSGTPGRKKDFRCLCVPLSEVKKCAKRRDASVTDFAMTVASGAIARWMEGRGEELKKDLVAFVPINVRGDGPFLALGNHISYQLVALHADVKEPAQRLAAIAADSARRASAVRTSDIAGLQRTAVALGPALLAVGARLAARFGLFNVAPPVANVMISSLPGPPFTLWLSGLRVRSIAPIGPLLGGFPLNITVLSYGDDLTFGLLGALNRVPDVARLRDYFLAEATFLLAAPAN